MEAGSCEDPQAKGAAQLALAKINRDRKEGYVFGLHRLSNVHMFKHVSPVAELHCRSINEAADAEFKMQITLKKIDICVILN